MAGLTTLHGLCFGELLACLLQQSREGLALLWIRADGQLRFKPLDVLARNEFLHEERLSFQRVGRSTYHGPGLKVRNFA